ncbi:MAG: hypothetical protein HY647_10610 [Acidobacteria bacterium]|nr:hypothetical protein [Acidobacteriota bacterium]
MPVSPLPSALPAIQTLDLRTEKTLTVKEAAFRLGKSEDAVCWWLRTGRLRGWQPGGRGCAILVSEDSVAEALSCTVVSGGTGCARVN